MSHEEDLLIADFLDTIRDAPWFVTQQSRINAACALAQKAHAGQKRKLDDTPYLSHCVAVAKKVFFKTQDCDATIAALIHDTAEDNHTVTMEMIYDSFGDTIGLIVDAVSDHKLHYSSFTNPHFPDKIEKLLWGGIRDVRALIIKICDREHNLETLDGLPDNKQIRMSYESQAVYFPLKRILRFDDSPFDLDQAKTNWTNYIKGFENPSPYDIKIELFADMFRDFDDNTHRYVYMHASNVIWKIDNKQIFLTMLENKGFGDSITISGMSQGISSGTANDDFLVEFSFKQGYFDQQGKNIGIGKLMG